MTLVAFDWLSISYNLVIGILVIVALFMGLVIMMQRPKQEGLGAAFGANVTDQVFGARTTNVLQRTTVYLASTFLLLTLLLGFLNGRKNSSKATLVADPAPVTAPAAPETPKDAETPVAPPAPEAPVTPEAPAPEAPQSQAPPAQPETTTTTPAPAPANDEKKPEAP